MIGERIKRAREAAGLNQRQLADLAGVTAMAISKYEREDSTPSSGVLLAIAKALSVRTEYFFRRTEVALTDLDYREHEKLPLKEEKKVIADVLEQVERWVNLEEFLPTPWSTEFKVPEGLPNNITELDQIEDVATQLRQAWNLGLNPVTDLIDMLESKGIKVFITRYDQHKYFDGLTAKVNDAPVIVVGATWSGDRQRFTLAHELGHLILKGRLAGELDEEMACHRFAGAFLAPRDSVLETLGPSRSRLEPQELYLLKHEWGLSMQAWSYRAFNLGIIKKSAHQSLWRQYLSKWKKAGLEPGRAYPKEQPRLFAQLVYRALGEDIITESKAAELLGMSVMELHACRKMECPNEVAH